MPDSVLIIGAGAAGLTAAYDLIRNHADMSVTILEANNETIGGRLRKIADFADFPIDVGGEWIHNVGPRILDEIVDNKSLVENKIWDVYAYTPDFRIYEDGEFEYDGFFEDQRDYHFINYTWFDFFNDYIAPISASNVVLGCAVSLVDYASSVDPIAVQCADGRSFSADKIIITVPLRILQEGNVITFDPPLPQAKLDAMADHVQVPPGAKLFLKFTQGFYFQAFQEEPTSTGERFFYDAAWNQDSDDFVLGMVALGDQVPVGTSPDNVKDSVLQTLDTMFSGIGGGTVATDSFVSFYYQDWTTERYIRGSYSFYVESGDCDDVIEILREPIGGNRIYFAGEHLPIDEEWGYVHGAALSGRDAARRLVDSATSETGDILGFLLSFIGFCFCFV